MPRYNADMRAATTKEIEEKARLHSAKGLKWHFHMLSPECLLNDKGQYAFILERAGEASLVHYSDKMEMVLRSQLLPLLHGSEVLVAEDSKYQPSKTVRAIISRAKQLNAAGVEWHHHVLFPDCIFNKHAPNWVLMFEDKQRGKILESMTEAEPIEDLKQIEPLF